MQIQEIFPGGIQGVILFAGGSPRPFLGQFNGSEISRGGPEPPPPPRFVYILSLLLSNIGLQDAKGF